LVVRTSAPVGKTPILKAKLTRDHLSAIGALTAEGRMIMQTQEHSDISPDVVRFWQSLLREIPGKLLVIWDSAPNSPLLSNSC
jgi:predicted O-linked N-acetylglucosamine transferase (SPINDLY family)